MLLFAVAVVVQECGQLTCVKAGAVSSHLGGTCKKSKVRKSDRHEPGMWKVQSAGAAD